MYLLETSLLLVLMLAPSVSAVPCFVNGNLGTCRTSCLSGESSSQRFCSQAQPLCCVNQGATCSLTTGLPTTSQFEIRQNSIQARMTIDPDGDAIQGCSPSTSPCSDPLILPVSATQYRWGDPVAPMIPGSADDVCRYNASEKFRCKSGIGFDPAVGGRQHVGVQFLLGKLYHYNFVITKQQQSKNYPTWLELSITLKIAQDLSDPGRDIPIGPFNFNMTLWETQNTNVTTCPHAPSNFGPNDPYLPCPDNINITSSVDQTANFTLPGGNEQYTLFLRGFRNDLCTMDSSLSFWTQETVVNEALMIAQVTLVCPSNCSYKPNGDCDCGLVIPMMPGTPGPMSLTMEMMSSPTTGIAIGAVAGVIGLVLLAVLAFLSYNKVTTGSWLGKKVKSENQVANNPLYQASGGEYTNPLFEDK